MTESLKKINHEVVFKVDDDETLSSKELLMLLKGYVQCSVNRSSFLMINDMVMDLPDVFPEANKALISKNAEKKIKLKNEAWD